MNGQTKWLIGVFLTILLAFGGAMLRAGVIETSVATATEDIDNQATRLRKVETTQAKVVEHIEHIDVNISEIKVLIKELAKEVKEIH